MMITIQRFGIKQFALATTYSLIENIEEPLNGITSKQPIPLEFLVIRAILGTPASQNKIEVTALLTENHQP